jgi:hypothetical protein
MRKTFYIIFTKFCLLIGISMLCYCSMAQQEIELPAYFPFFPLTANQDQVPLTGEPAIIPSDFDKNSILFLFQKTSPTNYNPLGTGFIIRVASLHYPHIYIPIPFIGKNVMLFHPYYIVTAKHVLFDEKGNLRPDVYLRFNNNTNGISYAALSPLITNQMFRVLFSTNKAVDMAIVSINVPSKLPKTIPSDLVWPNNINIGGFDSSLLLTPEKMAQYEIREGYDMFFIGLFVQFYGSYRNYPICRFGHLAMMPDEDISIAGQPPQKLFFMETSAYPGNSGSPAFFRTERSIPILKTVNLLSSKSGEHDKILLAGIVESEYLWQSDIISANGKVPAVALENAGIAAFVPATYIYEALFSKDEIKNRNLLLKMIKPKGYF